MSRTKKKEYKSMNILMDIHTREKLDAYCDNTGLTMTKAIERILDQYFEDYFARQIRSSNRNEVKEEEHEKQS